LAHPGDHNNFLKIGAANDTKDFLGKEMGPSRHIMRKNILNLPYGDFFKLFFKETVYLQETIFCTK
jgi:hypothetical protein